MRVFVYEILYIFIFILTLLFK